MRCNKRGHLRWTLALVVVLALVKGGVAADPPQGSVGPSDGSFTTWTGVAPTPTPSTTPTGAETFTAPATLLRPNSSEAGWRFTVNEPIQVTNVGIWDNGGDGLTQEHTIRIYDSQGRSILPITIIKGMDQPDLDPDGFRYVPVVDSVILRPGTYIISATYDSGGPSSDALGADGTTTDNTTAIAYIEGAFSTSTDPDEDPGIPTPDGSSGSYFGPNFKFVPVTPPAPALTFAGGTPAPPAQSGQKGWAFTVNRPVVVTDLGVYDEGGDELTNLRRVIIHNGNRTVIAAQFVSASDPIDSAGFRYRKLPAPVTLPAGSYTVSTFYSGSFDDPYISNASFIGTDPRLTYNGAVTDDGSCFSGFQDCIPDQRSSDRGYIGPNFRITPEAPKDQFVLSVEGGRVEYKQQGLRVKVDVEPAETGKDFDVYVYEAVPHPTPEPAEEAPPAYKEGPLVAYAAHDSDQGEVTYFTPSELGPGVYLVDVYHSSGANEAGLNDYNGTATVEPIPSHPAGPPAIYKTSSNGGTITFGPSVTIKAPFAYSDGNPQNRTDAEGSNYIAGMRGNPAGVDLWYIDLRPTIDDPDNPGQAIPNPNYDPNTRVPLYRGQPVPNFGSAPAFDGYLALAVAPSAAPAPLAFSELLTGMVTPGNSSDRGQSLSTNNPLVLPVDQNASPRAIAPQQWEEFLGESLTYLFYRTYAFDQGDTGEVFVHRSEDSGGSFDAPRNTNVAIGRPGRLDVDQTNGVIYGAGSTGNVLLGIPSNGTAAPDAYTLYPAVTDPHGVGHALFTTKVAADGVIYGVFSNGQDVFLVSSPDQGQTWSAATRVNSDTTQTNLFPWLDTGPPGKVGVVWYATANPPSAEPSQSPTPRQPNDASSEWKIYFAQISGANAPAPTIEIAEVTEPRHYIHAGNIFDRGYDPSSPEFDFTTTLTNHNLFDYIQLSFDPLGAAVVSYTDDHNDLSGNIYVARQITGPGINGVELPPLVQGKAPEGSGLTAPTPSPGDPTFPPPQPDPANGAQVTDFALDWNELGNDAMDVRTVRYGTTGGAGQLSIFAAMTVTNLNDVTALSNLSESAVPAWRMSFSVNPPHGGLSQTDPTVGRYSFAVSDRGDQFYFEGRENLQFFASMPVSLFLGMQPFEFVFGVATRNLDGSMSYSEIGPADYGFFNFNLNTVYVQVSVAKLNAALPPGRPLIGDKTLVAGLRGQTLIEPLSIGVHQGEQPVDTTRGGTEFQIVDSAGQTSTVQFSSGSYTVNESDGKAILVVTRSGDLSQQTTVDYATSDGTATQPADYTETHGTLTFAPGVTTRQISVDIIDDSFDEPAETFNVSLTNPQGNGTGASSGSPSQTIVSIIDNDSVGPTPTPSPAVIRFDTAQDNVKEANGFTLLTVTRSGDTSITVTVHFATGGDSATTGNDYIETVGSLTFSPGETAKLIKVQIVDDNIHEEAEDFSVTLSNPVGATLGSPSQAFVIISDDDVTPSPTAASQTVNLSTRMRVDTGDNVGIGGFIVTGNAPKHLIVRAIGPSLTKFGFTAEEVLADPVLEIHGPEDFATITNNNWRDSQEAQIKADGLPPTNDLESAIDTTLPPGSYTAIVKGNDNLAGIALVEVYDLDTAATSKLSNLSTRAFVDTGASVVIAGFVLGNNNGADRVVLRGLGPSLTDHGVGNALADPTLELRDENGTLLVANNDWADDPAQAVDLTAAGLAPSSSKESAIATALSPGLYTAILSGLDNGAGVGLVEVYDRGP